MLFTSVDGMSVRAEELGDAVLPVLEEGNPGELENSDNPDITGDEEDTQDGPSYVQNEDGAVIIRYFEELPEEQAYIELKEREELSEVTERMPTELTVYVEPVEGEDEPVEGEGQPGEGGDQSGENGDQPDKNGDQPGEGGDQSGEGGDQPDEGGDEPGEGGDQSGEGGDQSGEGGGQSGEGGDQSGEGEDQSYTNDVAAAWINGTYTVGDRHQWHLLVADNGANTYTNGADGSEGDANGGEDGSGERAGENGEGGSGTGTGEGGGSGSGTGEGGEGGSGSGTGEGGEGGNGMGTGEGGEGGSGMGTGEGGNGTGTGEGGNGTGTGEGGGNGAGTGTGDEDDSSTGEPDMDTPMAGLYDVTPPAQLVAETVPVIEWVCDDYGKEELDEYIFRPNWDTASWFFEESEEHKIPTIKVVYLVTSEVSTEEELAAAFAKGFQKITLQNDIALTKSLVLPADANIELDGGGYALTRGNVAAEGEEDGSSETFLGIMIDMDGENYTEDTYGTLTLKNITVDGHTDADRADAPVIRDRGKLILDENAVVRDNFNYGTYPKDGDAEKIPDYGGGIQVYGKLAVSQDALVTKNFADEWGGGVYLAGGATLYLYADRIVENSVSEDAGYGADLYADKGSTIYYDPALINIGEKKEAGLYYICDGARLFRLGSGGQTPEAEDSRKELYVYVDRNSGYTETQIAELKDELRMYGYTVLEGRKDIDTSDLKDWYVYDHYDTQCWGLEETATAPSKAWNDAYSWSDRQKRKFYPCTETNVGMSDIDTIEDWLASGSKTLARFREHIYVRKESGDTMMTFVGYGVSPYVDFMYYNPDSDGEKVVDFDVNSVAIDTHTLLGNGFLVNTGVDGNGSMSGYLVLYRYNTITNGITVADRLSLYKIRNGVTAEQLHTGPLSSMATEIAHCVIDSSEWQNQMSVQIRVTPERIVIRQQPYGKGTDISQTAPVLQHALEKNGYSGFGPLVAYKSHNCSSASSFTYSALSMYYTNPELESNKSMLSPIEEADFTQVSTQKYFIDLFGSANLYFDEGMDMGHQYREYMKLMQTEGVAMVTDRKTPFADYLGNNGEPGSNLFELGESGALPGPAELAAQIHEKIQGKTNTRMQEKVELGELADPQPGASAGNIWLYSAEEDGQLRKTLYGDDFAEGGYQIQVIDDEDITYYKDTGSATYEILKPNATAYEALGSGTAGEGFSFTIPKDDAGRVGWPAGVYTVRQVISGTGIAGYAYFTLKWQMAPPPTYRVNVNVRKDDEPWKDHGKSFWLLGANGQYASCGQAVTGTYTVTEGSANTGVPVTVTDRDTSVTLDYYTVTYYDREPGDSAAQPYGTNTACRPQIVLKGRNISRAAPPGRNGYHFDGWVNDKGETFDFTAKIEKKTDIYATWSTNVTVSIKVRKDNDPWEDHGKSFMLLPEGGTELIKPSDVGAMGIYVVYDVTGLEDATAPKEDRNTGVSVEVSAEEAATYGTVKEAVVDYYTVTFYDDYPDGRIYGDDTDQAQQTVLKGQKAGVPFAPTREQYSFIGWVTNDGSAEGKPFAPDQFNQIDKAVELYAKWEKIEDPRYKVVIETWKDGSEWKDADRTFALKGETEGEGQFIYDLEHVLNGTYRIYDISGGTPVSYGARAVSADASVKVGDGDTGVTVRVEGEDAAEVVDYYTVTFYDRDKAYGIDTPQCPMIVLKGKKAEKPETPPSKAGYRFIGWMTAKGGGTEFDFDQPVENRTDIFALFRANGKNSSSEEISENAPGGGGDIQMTTVSQEAESLPQAQTDGEPDADGKEPKTGDTAHVEIYATAAMIAGLTYLLLYFMEEGRGMTEREKEVFVAAFIRWAKKGGRFRKCCAIAAIFCLLVYYHSIGKRAGRNCLERECLRQAL